MKEETKKYEFVRFVYKGQPDNGQKNWWFVAKTTDDVVEHTKKVFKPLMQEGFDSYANEYIESIRRKCYWESVNGGTYVYVPHADNKVEASLRTIWATKNQITSDNPRPLELFETANSLYFEAFNNRIKDVMNGPIYLEDGVRQFGYSDGNPNYEIVERVFKDKLEYPGIENVTLEDVEFIQWPGGTHWYAKIRREDIVDACGNQKWNTRMEAMQAAKWYLETYYDYYEN